ncbi:MAG: acyl carrier protein, partial [Myxococcota bacterium]
RMVEHAASTTQEHPRVAKLRQIASEQRLGIVTDLVREQLARVMHTNADRIDITLSLDNMGVESLMGVELVSALKAEIGVELSAMVLMRDMSVAELAQLVLDRALPEAANATVVSHGNEANTTESSAADVDDMSEAELDQWLQAHGEIA